MKKRVELTEIIMEINDLREFDVVLKQALSRQKAIQQEITERTEKWKKGSKSLHFHSKRIDTVWRPIGAFLNHGKGNASLRSLFPPLP